MIGHLAAYDPAQVTPAGDYWVWRSARLDRRIIEDHHARIEAGHPFHGVNGTSGEQPCGGCLAMGSDWVCLYRYFAGGRDSRGRPGRFVLVCCFIPRRESIACDPPELLRQGPFSSIDAEALSHGAQLPQREAANLDLELSVSTAIEVESVRAWRREAEAGKPFHWIIGRGNDAETSGFRPITSMPNPGGRRDARTKSDPNPGRIARPINDKRRTFHMISKVVTFATYSAVAAIAWFAGMLYESRESYFGNRFAPPESERPIDEPALRRFLETYRNADDEQYINTKKLLERLDRRDWITDQQVHPATPSATMRHGSVRGIPQYGPSSSGSR